MYGLYHSCQRSYMYDPRSEVWFCTKQRFVVVASIKQHCVIAKIISDANLSKPGLGLAGPMQSSSRSSNCSLTTLRDNIDHDSFIHSFIHSAISIAPLQVN